MKNRTNGSLRGTAFGMACAAALIMITPALNAQDAISVDDAKAYFGDWTIAFEMQGNEREMPLKLMDFNGDVLGLLKFGPSPEPTRVTDITKTEEGIHLGFEMSFGDNAFLIDIDLALADDKLVGKLSGGGGLLTADLEGERGEAVFTEADASKSEIEEDPEVAERRRSRRRRGGVGRVNVTLNSKRVDISFGRPKVDGPSFGQVESAEPGTVLHLVAALPPKLMTRTDLAFGSIIVKQGNHHPTYPGAYSLWLKKTDAGWSLVFNSEADVWGTQRDAAFDVAEVPLDYSTGDESEDTFDLTLKDSDGIVEFRMVWGPHVWTTSFSGVAE